MVTTPTPLLSESTAANPKPKIDAPPPPPRLEVLPVTTAAAPKSTSPTTTTYEEHEIQNGFRD
ncbi:hypothetical protein EYF80_035417 [Liparis tanakae]|uniref:Uncharacterized protein n=1 Tax=Liparis tanakae TaxID=230148 RepID=A0A4Z2GM46_9TELE|nr:hypothetical protein EYF80_035417 [Liparis tanakae]